MSFAPHIMLLASHATVSGSLADPAGSSVLVAAVMWLQETLLGTVATTVAIIAIASVGLMMLTGRVNVRYGLTVIAGSFILFGAATIVAGIQASLAGGDLAATPYPPPPAAAPPPPPPMPPPPPANNDPYAGASVPGR
jgi:type IV secretory pathway VirB2 component (pilin)